VVELMVTLLPNYTISVVLFHHFTLFPGPLREACSDRGQGANDDRAERRPQQ